MIFTVQRVCQYTVNMEPLCVPGPFLELEQVKHDRQKKLAAARTKEKAKRVQI